MPRRVTPILLVAVLGGCAAWVACKADDPSPISAEPVPPAPPTADAPTLEPCSLPDLSRNTESETVADQLRRQYDALVATLDDAQATASDRGQQYGDMGKLLLGTEYPGEAEACFRNAQALAPRDRRWPYYLGHVSRTMGVPAQAAEFFEQARQLRPNDVATLVWLAEMHLEAGAPGSARPLLEHALALQPDSLAVTFGLGRVALERQDYFRAVEHLEAARALNPGATSVLTALASAYRSLGRLDSAEASLQQRQAAARAAASIDADSIIRPYDPLMDEVEASVRSAANYELRGVRELVAGDHTRAAGLFRSGLELQPANPSLRHKLGTALALMGDAPGAQEQFEMVVQQSPEYARAHFSLGVLMEGTGQDLQALGRYSAAVRHDPSYVEARLQLAGVLRRGGRPDDAMVQYEWIMELDPLMIEGPFGYAMVLVSLERWAEARDRLAEGIENYPHAPAFPLALARVLAAAPDDRIRDGRRAMALLERLTDEEQRIDFGETMAMTFAELGRFEEAVAWQSDAIAATRDAGGADLATRMAATLALYEAGKPSRTPWRIGELP